MVTDDFTPQLGTRWRPYVTGAGALARTRHTLCLVNLDAQSDIYTDAQIDDYQGLRRAHFPWRPPLTLTVRARFSHPCGVLRGTAGFGFWNDPFMMTGRRIPTFPRAIWFFYASSHSNMKLDLNTPGHGWKAATIDAMRWPFFVLLPTVPFAVPLMNIRPLFRALWPLGQRAIGVSEVCLDIAMEEWHTYVLEWMTHRSRFSVDGIEVLDCTTAPRGPLGFVMWLDNQYAVVTPWGRLSFGLLDVPGRQWLEVDMVTISDQVESSRNYCSV